MDGYNGFRGGLKYLSIPAMHGWLWFLIPTNTGDLLHLILMKLFPPRGYYVILINLKNLFSKSHAVLLTFPLKC